MPAYVVVDITVRDKAEYERYKGPAAAAVAAYGGRYLVRGGNVQVLEGSWLPGQVRDSGVSDRGGRTGLVGVIGVRAGQGFAADLCRYQYDSGRRNQSLKRCHHSEA